MFRRKKYLWLSTAEPEPLAQSQCAIDFFPYPGTLRKPAVFEVLVRLDHRQWYNRVYSCVWSSCVFSVLVFALFCVILRYFAFNLMFIVICTCYSAHFNVPPINKLTLGHGSEMIKILISWFWLLNAKTQCEKCENPKKYVRIRKIVFFDTTSFKPPTLMPEF